MSRSFLLYLVRQAQRRAHSGLDFIPSDPQAHGEEAVRKSHDVA
jgi:hypothetical protein